jgi:hypothetical protein
MNKSVFLVASIFGLSSAEQTTFSRIKTVEDIESNWSENVPLTPGDEYNRQKSYTDIDYTRRPVIGILSEPLRGEIAKQRLISTDESEPDL